MSVTAPPRPPDEREPIDREELEALVEALIEEARQRQQRRRRIYWAVATGVAVVAVAVFTVLERSAQSQTVSPTASAGNSLAAETASPQIAFTSRPLVPVGNQFDSNGIFVVNADGSGKRRLTPTALFSDPAWSPNGRSLAFARHPGGVFVINADGSGERRLAGGQKPVWSPDGRKIAFVRGLSRCGPRVGCVELHVIKVDGKKLRSPQRHVYIVLNKPKNVMSTSSDPEGRPTVLLEPGVGQVSGAVEVVQVAVQAKRQIVKRGHDGEWFVPVCLEGRQRPGEVQHPIGVVAIARV